MHLRKADELIEEIPTLLKKIEVEKPLIHHLTNFVVMNDTANLTLTYKALPVMAHAEEEVEEMVGLAGALVLNPGTLTREWITSMIKAGKKANELKVPVVLDPVGAGATRFRTESNLKIMQEVSVSVLRGNPGELAALVGQESVVKGVESVGEVSGLDSMVLNTSKFTGAVVAATGKRDIVSDGHKIVVIDNGHNWMRTITGTGCMATTAIASFCSVTRDYFLATIAGLVTLEIAAEIAAYQALGPQSFKTALFDTLFNLKPNDIIDKSKVFYLEG